MMMRRLQLRLRSAFVTLAPDDLRRCPVSEKEGERSDEAGGEGEETHLRRR